MIIGKWSIDVMYGPGAQEDTEIVFLPDGTGWIAFFHYELCELETFCWRSNENGSIRISGELYQTIGEPQEKSNLEINELFYKVKLENTPSDGEMKVIVFGKRKVQSLAMSDIHGYVVETHNYARFDMEPLQA
ncbi:hypothetical protein [Brevibacillus brevis]|uniref:hypothetical protein n=1 Tax=Brevibacillus brevis TaxID=1393 RepID=UPI0037C98D43